MNGLWLIPRDWATPQRSSVSLPTDAHSADRRCGLRQRPIVAHWTSAIGSTPALQHAVAQIRELTNMKALLTRAKNSYVDELKREIIKGKSGVDLGALFSD